VNDLYIHLSQALAGCRPLDLLGAERLAGQILAPLDIVMGWLAALLGVPVIGVALAPVFVAFAVASAHLAFLLVCLLLVGSAAWSCVCVDLGTGLGHALALISGVGRALGIE
jgi:hypothetical protein